MSHEYVVLQFGEVVETIVANTADEAYDAQTEDGDLYVRCGDPGNSTRGSEREGS